MPSSLDLPPLVPSDAPVPLNVAPLLHLLQGRNDEFAIRLADVLRQLQYATQIIWKAMKQEFPEFDSFELRDTDGSAAVTIGYENIEVRSQSSVANLRSNLLAISEGTDQLAAAVGGDSVVLNLVRNGSVDIAIQTTPSGVAISLAAGAKVFVNGTKVLTDQQATVNTIVGTAGAAYTATEQALLNTCILRINDLITRLQGMGTIA